MNLLRPFTNLALAIMSAFDSFQIWRASRRHRARVKKLRKMECELARAEGMLNAKQMECDLLTRRAKTHAWVVYDEMTIYSGQVAELKKRVEHCKQDVYA